MNAILPFEVKYTPLTKLALINFEKNPDSVYSCLELQYIDGVTLGKGFRVIAYRNDKYVDVYDEKTILFKPDERFDVTQKGLKQHVQRQFENTCFEKKDGKVHISFTIIDCDNRTLEVDILERTKKKSTPTNLLAPIGFSSVSPTYLPIFFLYNFDFVRKGKTYVKVLIDGKKLKLDPFPFPIPMDMQWRYYTRYSLESQIIDFLNADSKKVRVVELGEENKYRDGVIEYQFAECNGDMALSMLRIDSMNHPVQIVFEPPVSFDTHKGIFHIVPEPQMGSIDGSYQVTEESDMICIQVIPENGWTPDRKSAISKMIFSEKSIFCNWCKKYIYTQKINKKELFSEAKWFNTNSLLNATNDK